MAGILDHYIALSNEHDEKTVRWAVAQMNIMVHKLRRKYDEKLIILTHGGRGL
jgi:hypothetical protein